MVAALIASRLVLYIRRKLQMAVPLQCAGHPGCRATKTPANETG